MQLYLLVKDIYFSDKVKEINKQTLKFILKKYVISTSQKIAGFLNLGCFTCQNINLSLDISLLNYYTHLFKSQ